jgi:hypothetical protein
MSGYLQRLATTAMNPPRSIHPVVGSVYAAPAQAPGLEEPQVDDVPMAAPPGDQDGAAAPPEERAPKIYPEESRFSAVERQAFDSGTKPAPLVSPGGPEQTKAELRTGARMGRQTGRLLKSHPDGAGAPEPGRQTAPPEGTAPSAARYQPLVTPPADDHVPDNFLLTLPENRQVLPAQKSRALHFAKAAQRAEAVRAPDEIQIHIGRIEVTAVPPPAPRPAPKVERKSVNLDEYLKGRQGRNR